MMSPSARYDPDFDASKAIHFVLSVLFVMNSTAVFRIILATEF